MNKIMLCGRLTKDIEVKYLPNTQTAVVKNTLAIERGDKDGSTDFVPIVVFGKSAENMERYTGKGKKIIIEGRIQTGSYEKDGKKIYTTDVVAERIEFVEWKEKEKKAESAPAPNFSAIEEDIPF